jgi:hypothetical protein
LGENIRDCQQIKEITLAVPEIFNTIEQTGISKWIRYTPSMFGFYFILLCHTIGLSLLVGTSAILDLRILGIASALPLKPMKQLFRFIWVGLAINVTTGLLLLTGYPTKALTDLDFYVKISFITLAVLTMRRLYLRVFADPTLTETAMIAKGKLLAKFSIFFWIGAVWAGRMLSETYTYITYGHKYAR